MSTCERLCQHVSKSQQLIYSTKTTRMAISITWTFLSLPPRRSRRHLENISMVRGKDQKLPAFLITFSRCENTFIPPCWCQISQQLRSFESTCFSPPTGQVHIPCQLYLRPNMMKITHISKPDMVGSCFCSRLAGNLLHMHDPVYCEYITQWAGISTSSNYNYLYCFKMWVGHNYLLPFQVYVDMFLLGYRVLPLRFTPFWVRQNSGSKFSDCIWVLTYSTLCSCSMNMFNRSFNQFSIPQSFWKWV